MTIVHHPDEATLMSFAAGALPESLSAVIGTHLVACPCCRSTVREMDAIGGCLLGALEATARMDRTPQLALEDRTTPATTAGGKRTAARSVPAGDIETAIERLSGFPLADIPWQRLGFGVWHHPIKLGGDASGDLRLLKVQRGQAMPEHGHGGCELTLVLDGAYTDEVGTFGAGDVADLDDSVEHRPVADASVGCVCLIASERRARFKGMIGRLLQPLSGM